MSLPRDITVIGAGIVGICAALHLQRRGHRVRVLDNNPPGSGASAGNSGIFSTAAVVPLATPGVIRAVPRMLMDPRSALKIRWRHLPWLATWLVRFLASSRPDRVEEASRALAAILAHARESYLPLLRQAGVEDLMRPGGYYEIYESEAGYAGSSLKATLRHRRGVVVEELDGDQLRVREPALSRTVHRGVALPDSAFCPNPLRLVQMLAADFLRQGGVIERRRVVGFAGFGPQGPRQILCADGLVEATTIVLAAGAWSRDLALRLGTAVPLTSQRGYHAMIEDAGVSLSRPVVAGEAHMVMTPMERGLCLTGTLELAGLHAPPRFEHARAMIEHGRRLLPGLRAEKVTTWMGHRPGMPDSLPVIGRAPRAQNVIFAFGHGALGLTVAAITGRLVADLVDESPSLVDLGPFRADRF